MKNTAFAPTEIAALLRALSDFESGSPRQWLFLELASLYPPPTHKHFYSRYLRRFGPTLCSHWLAQRSMPAMALYQSKHQHLLGIIKQNINDASLLLAGSLALLAGFGRLPASMQFVCWLLWIGGGCYKLWRWLRQPAPHAHEVSGEEALPGTEAALGLQSLLLARGLSPSQAGALLQQVQNNIDMALPALLNILPELEPPPLLRHHQTWAILLSWSLVLLPAPWLLGWTWGWLSVIALLAFLSGYLHRRPLAPALIILTSLFCYGLARFVHWL